MMKNYLAPLLKFFFRNGFIFQEIDRFKAPDWGEKKTIWYQIFPQSDFANGETRVCPQALALGSKNTQQYDFYGGDYKGLLIF